MLDTVSPGLAHIRDPKVADLGALKDGFTCCLNGFNMFQLIVFSSLANWWILMDSLGAVSFSLLIHCNSLKRSSFFETVCFFLGSKMGRGYIRQIGGQSERSFNQFDSCERDCWGVLQDSKHQSQTLTSWCINPGVDVM